MFLEGNALLFFSGYSRFLQRLSELTPVYPLTRKGQKINTFVHEVDFIHKIALNVVRNEWKMVHMYAQNKICIPKLRGN